MIELEDWLKYIKDHPLKFRFEGLHSRRGSKDAFHETVGEAACADERFIDDYMYKEYESQLEGFDKAVAARKDNDEFLSRFCEFAEHRMSAHKWNSRGLPFHGNWSEAPLEDILRVVDAYSEKLKDDYIRDWVVGDWDLYEDMVKDDSEHLLKEHPPVAVWATASDSEIALEDVFFLCPSCSEPQTEKDLVDTQGVTEDGHPRFYCGGCGSSMATQNILDFFNSLEITPYPFDAKKQEIWKKRMAERKAT